MSRIRAGRKEPRGRIPRKIDIPDDELMFSLKHVQVNHPVFSPDDCREGYLKKFLERLQSLNHMRVSEFRSRKGKALRAHRINWEDTSQAGFTNIPQQLADGEHWQFEVSVNEHGRVHGILISNLFYIIWIDPEHKLYPRRNRGK